MCDELYQTALRFADVQATDHVFDLYCGLGSLSLLLAARAAAVDAVEVQPEAIAAAEQNARLNAVANVRFHVGDVRKVLKDPPPPGRADVVVVDPPRAGLSRKALARAAALGARRFVYVSCNPTTLAGNAAELDRARLPPHPRERRSTCSRTRTTSRPWPSSSAGRRARPRQTSLA